MENTSVSEKRKNTSVSTTLTLLQYISVYVNTDELQNYLLPGRALPNRPAPTAPGLPRALLGT